MAKVYVVNYAGHNVEKAKKYGKITMLTFGRVDYFNTDRLLSETAIIMKDLEIGDFILLSGSPMINVLVSMLVLSKFRKINLLVYNAKSQDYQVRTISLDDTTRMIREVSDNGRKRERMGFSRITRDEGGRIIFPNDEAGGILQGKKDS